MALNTHLKIDQRLCGTPLKVENGKCWIELKTLPEMAADQEGLVHGGFVFGLADFAAMGAVNHPNVVLGAASTKFLKPVSVGETLIAKAEIEEKSNTKIRVKVNVQIDEQIVFSGEFTTFILEEHVLKNP